ncbi:LytTR family transcriptional regulator [Halobacillus kuroshimensis]|uniref:LytTR family transcriptional regulator n=1 Tax=Halobacillus kuroshimensis TaxID=302481 RepID=A0ABS3DR52_9BACI|nr:MULTISPECIES: LytTR family DNA-binding domain-containing protein [Halobacillus]MBN8233816.1 LytTR family transcriptional regulator [Halobacillus kuroshimensis]
MKVSIDVDENHPETSITIHCSQVDDTVKEILDFLHERKQDFVVGKNGESQHILKPEHIQFFRSEDEAVFAYTRDASFKVKDKLYELERSLPSQRFVRISKSVLANLYEMSRFEPSFNGTLCVYFKSGEKEYASRHYVGNIKEMLNMNRRDSR